MHPIIESHREAIHELCRAHRVKDLYLFGSAVEGGFQAASDIDFVVSFDEQLDPIEHGTQFLRLKEVLELLLQRDVDLLIERAIKNPVLRNAIDGHKALLYAA